MLITEKSTRQSRVVESRAHCLQRNSNLIIGQDVNIDGLDMRDDGLVTWHSQELRDWDELIVWPDSSN
jgi:hypothetical protein